jgi:phospholipid-binding lipoprotein MlaA
MLPVLGPSNVRDATGRVADAFLDPVPYAVDKDSRLTFQIVRRGLDALDKRARNIETLDDIERNSIDFYAAIRSLYRQHRAAQISNGQGPRNPMPGVGAMPGMSDLKFDDDSGGVEKADASPSD